MADVLLATGDPVLLDDLRRLAAAADVTAEVVRDAGEARAAWHRPALLLLGADLADGLIRAEPPRRPGVVLVVPETGADDGAYRRAVEVGAHELAALPRDETWLVDAMAAVTEPPGGRAGTVCVTGGSGGAGASVLAAVLGLAGARRGLSTLLVDGDPLGGGLDLLLGREDADGARWADLAGRQGRINAAGLHEALPKAGDLAVLSWSRDRAGPVAPAAMGSVLAAAARGFDLVVVDVPRRFGDADRVALDLADLVLLVVRAELRAVVAADQAAAALRDHAPDLRLIVRGPAPGGLTADAISVALDLPVAGKLPDDRRVPAALERGELIRVTRRGPLIGLCERLVDDVRRPTSFPRAEAA
ncbi:hypothetical protein DPM19_14065 [Actinomadura craniellae]|uniref:Rv3660c-like CheY-like N-terminal domain-containing protein n=1 Tax=Actinomadura craniellae TaxID=2231787 RepID=A0A365H766_9ACTN|nr:septum site-determining protein Ssd [Actinomadura craniellae]RAY14842.1 hypothetical protein DPM19_14065 [Actinomadura craniellae]